MQNMLKKIVSVDKKARESVEEARREREDIELKLKEASKSIQNQRQKETDKEIALIKKENERKCAEITAEYKEKLDCQMSLIEERYEKKKDEWVNEIFARVTEV